MTPDLLYDIVYMSDVYIGSNREAVRMLWDTGSDWAVIQGSINCSSCNPEYAYHSEWSSTFKIVNDTEFPMIYGSAIVIGLHATDNFYLSEDAT